MFKPRTVQAALSSFRPRGILRSTSCFPQMSRDPALGKRLYWSSQQVHAKTIPFQQNTLDKHPFTMGTARFFDGTTDNESATLDFRPGQESGNLKPNKEMTIKVTDIRDFDPPASLAVEGCEFVHSPTALCEDRLLDPDKDQVAAYVESVYYPDCVNLVKRVTNASQCVPFHWRYRRQENESINSPVKFVTRPVKTFHIDNDKSTAEAHLRRAVGPVEAARWFSRHWAILNVWRPVGDVVQQWPLAILDSRCSSLDQDKHAEPVYTENNYKSHFTALRFQPHYKFYYASNMTPDEAVLFVDYDSKQGDTLNGIAHGAFEDHGSPENVPLRRSVEVRVLALLD